MLEEVQIQGFISKQRRDQLTFNYFVTSLALLVSLIAPWALLLLILDTELELSQVILNNLQVLSQEKIQIRIIHNLDLISNTSNRSKQESMTILFCHLMKIKTPEGLSLRDTKEQCRTNWDIQESSSTKFQRSFKLNHQPHTGNQLCFRW